MDYSKRPDMESDKRRSLRDQNVSPIFLQLLDATIRGDEKACRKILKFHIRDINQVYGIWDETPLHLAVDKGHQKICLQLLSKGASPKTKDKWGRTPLHTASSKGNQHICKELLNADATSVDATDKGNWTPLHMASSYGHRKICQLLIQSGANIDACTTQGTTALQLGSTNGHIGVCRLLIQGESRIDAVNVLGRSALHFASKNAHSDVCRLLISSGADILATDTNKNTPLDLWPTRVQQEESINRAFGTGLKLRDYHQLMQAGSTPIQTVKLFLCGNPAVGKTSLKKALAMGRLKAKITEWRTHRATARCPTPGISVTEKQIYGSGRFCVWDCAGQVEFHLTHSMFLGVDNGIFIIVCGGTGSEENQKAQISYWMSFIKAGHDPSKERKPIVIIVRTHVDQVANPETARGISKKILEELTTLFHQHLDICQECFLVDTHRSFHGDMINLRKMLRILADPLRGELTPRMCDEIKKRKSSWCRGKYPVLYWKELEKRAKDIDRYCEEDLIETAINHLHDMGELHRARIDSDDDVIILDPNWLTSAIFGPIFARPGLRKKYLALEEKQLYTVDDLAIHFDLKDTDLLMQLLTYFELAHWYDDQHLIIPSKLPDKLAPVVWDEDNAYTKYYTGRCIQCRDETDMIAASVFPCLQIRIMNRYHMKTHRPIISRMAIKFAHKVEGMVQLAKDKRAIMLAVRSQGQDNQTLQNAKAQIDELILIVFSVLEQRSIGTQVVTRYLSPASLRRSTDLETGVHSYTKEEVVLAEEEGLPLINPCTNNTESVEDVIGPGYSKQVSNNILRWRTVLRSTEERLCSDIVPSDILHDFTNILTQEDEQVIKTKESNEGPIRAARLLVSYLLASTDTRWPDMLLIALENRGLQHLFLLLSEEFKLVTNV